jgi:ATP sulfurylase
MDMVTAGFSGQIQIMNQEIKEKFPEWAARYEEMRSLIARIQVARIMVDEKRVIELLVEVDNLFREENYN